MSSEDGITVRQTPQITSATKSAKELHFAMRQGRTVSMTILIRGGFDPRVNFAARCPEVDRLGQPRSGKRNFDI
jgi:hypothetical protein